jgi:hypothetical protein
MKESLFIALSFLFLVVVGVVIGVTLKYVIRYIKLKKQAKENEK